MNEILLYGPIGADFWEPENGITAKSVMEQLSQIDGDVTVRISSGGGDVYEGVDVMSTLKNHPGEVTVIVESLAASAASFIAVGGADRVLMRESSEMMIHRAMTFTDGNADDVRKTLADLERQDVKLANIYAGKAGGDVDQWLDLMSEETWYTAEEAVAAGLADEVIREKKAEPAPVPSSAVARKRFRFANRAAAPPPPVTRSVSGDDNNKTGAKMDILNQLAQELGRKPEELRNALSGFFNAEVTVTSTVEVTYPEDNKITPTGKLVITPQGDIPPGLTFAVGDLEDGWTVEVDESTGVLTMVAPLVEPGTTVDVPVTATPENGDPVDLTASVAVKSAAEEGADETPPDAPVEDPGVSPDPLVAPTGPTSQSGMVMVPQAHYERMSEALSMHAEGMQAQAKADREKRVDADIQAGRFFASERAEALATLEKDPATYEKSWGKLPANKIARTEIGHAGTPADDVEGSSDVPTRDEMIARANARIKKGNK